MTDCHCNVIDIVCTEVSVCVWLWHHNTDIKRGVDMWYGVKPPIASNHNCNLPNTHMCTLTPILAQYLCRRIYCTQYKSAVGEKRVRHCRNLSRVGVYNLHSSNMGEEEDMHSSF